MVDTSSIVMKVLAVGESGTGKTSIINRIVKNSFSANIQSTVGVDFQVKHLQFGDRKIQLQLWDVAGQERFGSAARVYYRGAVGVFVVYDISRPQTFDTVEKWKAEIDENVKLSDGNPVPVVVLGNKSDLENAECNKEFFDVYYKRHKFIGGFDTSAKKNINLDDAVYFLVKRILSLPNASTILAPSSSSSTFQPGVSVKNAKQSCC